MKQYKLLLKKIIVPSFLILSLSVSASSFTFANETAIEASAAETISASEMHSPFYSLAVDSNEWESWPYGPAIEAQSAIVMDYYTGAVLYEKAADTVLYPASITKIMTTLLACEKNSMKDPVVISENAVQNISPDSSRAYLEPGETLTMEQLLMTVMLQSANDAAYQIAEQTSGSMKKFVELMNLRARQLGCTHTHFNNPHGLHSQYHYTTARDMATIMKAAWRNPLFSTFASTVTYEIPPTNKNKESRYYLNNHKMMKTEAYEYPGVLGGKTGYTDEAGNTLVTVARHGSMTVVVVVLNGIGGAYADTSALLDYAFANFKNVRADTLLKQDSQASLFYEQFLSRNELFSTVLSPISKSYLTLPKGVSTRQLSTMTMPALNSPSPALMETDFYYNGRFVGNCYSY